METTEAATVVAVPVLSLRPADSPRLNGQDKAHIARLTETETPLPPILVDKRTMRVVDGMHRLMAASRQGRETIDVIFFGGREADVFLRAVQENIAHGLPLSQADRRAAAVRIIASHPHLSNRAIGHSVGLAAKTVAAIRKTSSDEVPQPNARVGKDGRVRPLDSDRGRRRAAEILAQRPDASLREVARAAGISPATVRDVRSRLERGDSPALGKPAAARDGALGDGTARDDGGGHQEGGAASVLAMRPSPCPAAPDPAAAVEKLMRDPSLRGNDRGKGMLRLLHVNAVGAGQLLDVAGAVPPHCVGIVMQLARQYSNMWQDFAQELDSRARIIDQSGASRLVRGPSAVPARRSPHARKTGLPGWPRPAARPSGGGG
jgi:ParB-like chromosome segregation protein Spo0J